MGLTARLESCYCGKARVLNASFPPLDLFFFILSTCCITVLDIPGFINRTAFWAGDKVIQSGYDQLLLFRKLCLFPALVFFFLFFLYLAHSYSRSAAVMVGYSDFLDGFLCLQLVSMILLPATLDGLLCSSMITGSVHDTSLHFFLHP